MHKGTFYKAFRCLVCLLVICCILVNASFFRVEASSVVAGSIITGTGLFATLFSMALGAVFVDLTADIINDMGISMVDHLYSNVTEDETEILDVWIQPIQIDLDSGGSSDPEQDPDGWGLLAGLFSIPSELLDNLLSWGKSLITNDGIEIEGEAAAEGYAFYNGHYLPLIETSGYPVLYYSIKRDTYSYFGAASSAPYYQSAGDSLNSYDEDVIRPRDSSMKLYDLVDGSWSLRSSGSGFIALLESEYTLLWARQDIYNKAGSSLYFAGSEPSDTATTVVSPSIYVGDIPQQVQDGTFEEEKYELTYINYSQVFKDQTDAIDALNNVATQLQNQTMTYQEYMDLVQTPTGPGSSSDIETPSPVPELEGYVFDLRDFFPFCIPFDLFDFFAALHADPVAPKFHWEIQDLNGKSYSIDIDLSAWDNLASLFRTLQLLLFVTGLAAASRKFIKW